MPIELNVFKRDTNGRILRHSTYAANSEIAHKMMEEHARGCPSLGPAIAAGKTIEIEVEIDEIPEFDEQELEEFLELDDDEEPEDEEEEEEEEEEEHAD